MAAAAALLQGRCAVPRASRPEGTGVPPGRRPGAAGELTDLGSCRAALASIKSWQLSRSARSRTATLTRCSTRCATRSRCGGRNRVLIRAGQEDPDRGNHPAQGLGLAQRMCSSGSLGHLKSSAPSTLRPGIAAGTSAVALAIPAALAVLVTRNHPPAPPPPPPTT